MDDKGPVPFPKWVLAHESRIFRKKIEGLPEAVSVQGFDQCHVNRANGEVTVLVQSENEENEAISPAKEPEVAPADISTDHISAETTPATEGK